MTPETPEKVTADSNFTEAYLEWAGEDKEGSEVRRGALAASTHRWRDE